VITAGRLRNKTPPNSVTITASTRKLLGSVFVYDNLELGEFDGLSEPLTPYLVTGKRAVDADSPPGERESLQSYVGRQHELQQISTLWDGPREAKAKLRFFAVRLASVNPVSVRNR
jgi:hypothetical protein